jgi:glycosyltransferase involved in cell wall biosynthesis
VTVTVVATSGRGSMDRYGQQLAAHLPGPHLEVDLARTTAGRFGRNGPGALLGDAALVRRLRGTPGLPHLTHHHTARYGPLLGRPYVVTAHDLIRWSDLRGAGLISELRGLDRLGVQADALGVRRAAHVVAPSEATRQDLVRCLGLPPERVTVVPEGVDGRLFRPVPPRRLDRPYVLFVGSEHPRKNLAAVLRAFALLRSRGHDLRLVKVGAPGDGEAPFHAAAVALTAELGVGPDVVLAGEVADDELPAWYAGAVCLVLPSLAEGFGLPPVEAAACGCPSVVSTAGALPEITAGCALTVGPHDVAGLADAVERLLLDGALRDRLVARGLERAGELTWERVAKETAAVHEAVLLAHPELRP